MLQFCSGDMFRCGADVLVNPINCVGVMGKGLALHFKQQYPDMFNEYKRLCSLHKIDYGVNFWWYANKDRVWICNMPTKRDWRNDSDPKGVETSLLAFWETLDLLSQTAVRGDEQGPEGSFYASIWRLNGGDPRRIRKIAMPAVGCGLGGLSYEQWLMPLMQQLYTHNLSVKQDVLVFAPTTPTETTNHSKGIHNMETTNPVIPKTWTEAIATAIQQPIPDVVSLIRGLEGKVQQMREDGAEIFPPQDMLFRAMKLTTPKTCKAVLIGQDPYHNDGQAMGLSFSVPDGVALPPSLKNIYTELCSDIGCERPQSGDLTKWGREGVLLLNASLSVEAHKANSHAGLGWDELTSDIVFASLMLDKPIVYILWGAYAQGVVAKAVAKVPEDKKQCLQDKLFLKSAHPSPLSVNRGFYGSKPFSKANAFLAAHDVTPIDWSL